MNIPKILLKTPILVAKKIGMSVEGENLYETTFSGYCRLEMINKEKYNKLGDLPEYNWIAYLNGDINVVLDSQCKVSQGGSLEPSYYNDITTTFATDLWTENDNDRLIKVEYIGDDDITYNEDTKLLYDSTNSLLYVELEHSILNLQISGSLVGTDQALPIDKLTKLEILIPSSITGNVKTLIIKDFDKRLNIDGTINHTKIYLT